MRVTSSHLHRLALAFAFTFTFFAWSYIEVMISSPFFPFGGRMVALIRKGNDISFFAFVVY